MIQILTTVHRFPPDLDHVTTLEQVPVLMVTPRTHVSVWMAMPVTTVPWTLIPVIQIPVRMVEHAPTPRSLLLNAHVLRDFQGIPVVYTSPHVSLSPVAMDKVVLVKVWDFTLATAIPVLPSVQSLPLVITQ